MANLKQSRIAKLFYNFPGAASAYHFLWAWTGATVYRHPSKKLFVIGVTGTKGKTTTLELINAILEAVGKRTALLSSLRIKVGGHTAKNHTGNSMPGRTFIENFLHKAVRDKCEFALIEVTSQGVVLHRHKFIKWDMGVLTNLSPEHIEAHGSFENYRAAKLSFLEYVIDGGGEVFLNRDDKHFQFFFDALAHDATAPTKYSREDEFLKNALPRIRATRAEEMTSGAAAEAGVPRFLLSDFNEENVAVAAAIGRKLGVADDVIEKAILNFGGVPGRMEFVRAGEYTGVVDYAHTPDSLEAAYRAVKPKPTTEYPHPRLIAVLGACGGSRDKWKRAPMGEVAAKWADEIILTNEDPYEEDPEAIVDQIEKGIRAASNEKAEHAYRIMDREQAVRKAFALALPGDVVIGTGKGSEDWIHVANNRRVAWNERQEFEKALRDKASSML
jgi:UDP-N-acetylmuramoyl-L-alanyl-D-glutamate--2,6-diaminopimelate ligase